MVKNILCKMHLNSFDQLFLGSNAMSLPGTNVDQSYLISSQNILPHHIAEIYLGDEYLVTETIVHYTSMF